jgi:hypothetical protein
VRKYITELPDFDSRITIRQLVHHTSGLRNQWPLLCKAGWRYSLDLITDDDVLTGITDQVLARRSDAVCPENVVCQYRPGKPSSRHAKSGPNQCPPACDPRTLVSGHFTGADGQLRLVTPSEMADHPKTNTSTAPSAWVSESEREAKFLAVPIEWRGTGAPPNVKG